MIDSLRNLLNASPRNGLIASLSVLLFGSSLNANETRVDAAVNRAISYLESEGVGWIKERGCVSCHQIPLMLWSLSAARNHGYDVNTKALSRWQKWSVRVKNFVKPEQKESVVASEAMSANIDTMSALMLAIDPAEETEPWRQKFAEALIKNQRPDGSWKSCGQLPLQKRDAAETTRVTGLWTLNALTTAPNLTIDTAKAMAVIDASSNNQSTEWWAARMLLEQRRGNERTTALADELIKHQNEDGGWGWILGQPSDALGTGMALYAISRSNCDHDEVIERAASRLIADQKSDGSWAVPGTKKSTQKKTTATANYWGTAWAVIGLIESDLSGG